MKGAAAGAAVVVSPAVFNFLGYHFQAGPLVVGLAGVVLARFMVPIESGVPTRWSQEIPVMAFCAFLTALLLQDTRNLLYSGLTGIAIGGLGVGALKIIKVTFAGRFQAALAAFLTGEAPPRSRKLVPRDDDAEAIERLTAQLHEIPLPDEREP